MEKTGGFAVGVIGYTDGGLPIVTSTYCCDFFAGQKDSLCLVSECWYCKYADFRKNTRTKLNYSICHNSKGRY